ncbi:MAG: hypothetical protein GIKADHBN_00572 [Phycisphaerales bacterium]|nr:hypothetical protein [Phycisphaerales bacterium]
MPVSFAIRPAAAATPAPDRRQLRSPPVDEVSTRALRLRSIRVTCLVIACLAMSAADLIMTLTHATTIGFAEGNPIARFLMDSGSAGPVTAWKLATLGVALGILWSIRKTRTGELGAWLAVAILVWLMARWSVYNDHIQLLTSELARGTATTNVCWVHME